MTRRTSPPSTRDVIEATDLAAPPSRAGALLAGDELASWRCGDREVVFRFDVVGEHVVARLTLDTVTPGFLALACRSTSIDLGWAGTRVHVAIAPVPGGSRIAIVHAGVPAAGASREIWRGLLDELRAHAA